MNYSDYFDKIYIITYVKNINKRENICKELKRIGINDYEFAYSYNTSVINNPNNIDNNVLSISFTHYDIIKKSYELGMEHILIFEDDVMFLKYGQYALHPKSDSINFTKSSTAGLYCNFLRRKYVYIIKKTKSGQPSHLKSVLILL